LNYSEKLSESQNIDSKEHAHDKTTLNGRKLSARTLKNQLKISPHLIEEAKNYIFVKESLSLIPQILPLPSLNTSHSLNNYTYNNLTLAEMAVIPINSININTNSSIKQQKSLHPKKTTHIPSFSPNSLTLKE
jgi:hypothetical protein